mgnify:CR=1 FL=1
MKKILTFIILIALSMFCYSEQFIIQVPEDDYNQVQIHNMSSVKEFSGKLYKIEKQSDKEFIQKGILGTFIIKDIDDTCTFNKKTKKDTFISVNLPAEFDGKFSYELEHKDFPMFDILVIHIIDKED